MDSSKGESNLEQNQAMTPEALNKCPAQDRWNALLSLPQVPPVIWHFDETRTGRLQSLPKALDKLFLLIGLISRNTKGRGKLQKIRI